jgi:hypothetical protein
VLILSILPIVFLNVRLQGHTHIRSTNEKSTISGQFVVTRAHASATLASRSRSSARFEQANVWCPFTISRPVPVARPRAKRRPLAHTRAAVVTHSLREGGSQARPLVRRDKYRIGRKLNRREAALQNHFVQRL